MRKRKYIPIPKYVLMAAVFVSLNSPTFCEPRTIDKPCTPYNITFDPSVLDEIEDLRKHSDAKVMVIQYQDCNAMDQYIDIEKKGPYSISAKPGTDIRIGNTYGGQDVAEIIVPMVSAGSVPIQVYCLWTVHDMPSMQCDVRPPALPVTPPAAPLHKKP